MAKKEKEDGAPDEVIQVQPKKGEINLHERVKVEVQEGAPHHKAGDIVECSPHVAAKMEKNGWGKILSMLFILFAFAASAQTTSYQKLAKIVGPGTTITYTDTVTNTGVNFLTTGYPQSGTSYSGNAVAVVNLAYTSAINVLITRLSGTAAGTVTLQGSLDGVTYSTVTNPTYAGTYTFTPTNVATQSVSFVLPNNPFRFYRVSYTGAGTMACTIAAQYWSH